MHQDVWNREGRYSAQGLFARGLVIQGARMTIAAVVSAVLSATLVIAVGQSLIERRSPAPGGSDAVLIRAAH